MKWEIEQLTQNNALVIANDWHYPGQYSFYDMSADIEDYQEIVTPSLRQDHYYQVMTADKMVGFFVIEQADKTGVDEIGLGLEPTLTGHGLGGDFVSHIISFVENNFVVKTLRLDVAEFNVRAQKVYQKLGFKVLRKHNQLTNGGTHVFIEMEK